MIIIKIIIKIIIIVIIIKINLTLVLLNPDVSCLCKQCRSEEAN